MGAAAARALVVVAALGSGAVLAGPLAPALPRVAPSKRAAPAANGAILRSTVPARPQDYIAQCDRALGSSLAASNDRITELLRKV